MEHSLFGFILRYSKREQIAIVPLVVASMVVYFFSLDLPKIIINEAIQGRSFTTPGATAPLFRLQFDWPGFLGGGTLTLFDGFSLERVPFLLALSVVFLGLIVVNGLLKVRINTMKGWMGERMLRRLRFILFDRILRFPLPRFRRVKSAEVATMIKDEVEPLGGFIGEALITPLFLGGQAITAVIFILVQHAMLGMIAVFVVVIQAVLIPRLRRRLLVLSRQRQLGGRQLAGRISECVDGIVEIHANDTSNYERAEISSRLGILLQIRLELYQRKFLIKFINNFLSQVTPFLFYALGGYLVIVGRLDIGALVAVIAAYKDLPSPVKELIDWDQERLDVSMKYAQVVEQFTADDLLAEERQQPLPAPALPAAGSVKVSNLTLTGDTGDELVASVSFEIPLTQHVALLGDHRGGGSELAQMIAALVVPTHGTVSVGSIDVTGAPEAVNGRALGYVGNAAYLFPTTVRENLLYGLKHFPLREARYAADQAAEHGREWREAERSGNSMLDINADWIDYTAAGADNEEGLDARIDEILRTAGLEETILAFGLRSAPDPARYPGMVERVIRARAALAELSSATDLQGLVERFDPERYLGNATLAENLLFGTSDDASLNADNMAGNAYVRRVLRETGLEDDLLEAGRKVAETMVELFSGLPPEHEMFERFSFIRPDDLGYFRELLARVSGGESERIEEADGTRLLALTFKLITSRHRLGLIDEAMQARLLEARRHFARHLPAELRGTVQFFDPLAYNSAESLQDNILFGKVVTTQAGAAARIGQLLREMLDAQGLRELVIRIGLEYGVGVGATRLTIDDRQRVAIARALLKRPAVLVLDEAVAVLDLAAQRRFVTSLLEHRKGQCVIWALRQLELGELFDHVVVMQEGRLVERGRFEHLRSSGGVLQKLLGSNSGG